MDWKSEEEKEVHKKIEVKLPQNEFTSTQIPLVSWKFNRTKSNWEEYKLDKKELMVKKDSFSLLTYNIYFDKNSLSERLPTLMKLMKESNVDVICIQEAIVPFMDELLQQDWVRDEYYSSHIKFKYPSEYDVRIISKIPFQNISYWKIPSNMGRKLLVAEYSINGSQFAVATIHLESLNNAIARRDQLIISEQVLSSFPSAILCGDFNFDSTRNFEELTLGISKSVNRKLENDNLKQAIPLYVDLWSQFYPNEKGYTFDSEVNTMINQYEQMRYDRVMLRSSEWIPSSIRLIGTDPIKKKKTISK